MCCGLQIFVKMHRGGLHGYNTCKNTPELSVGFDATNFALYHRACKTQETPQCIAQFSYFRRCDESPQEIRKLTADTTYCLARLLLTAYPSTTTNPHFSISIRRIERLVLDENIMDSESLGNESSRHGWQGGGRGESES